MTRIPRSRVAGPLPHLAVLAAESALRPQVLAGRYQLGAVLGQGGMAQVRVARDLLVGRAVAVKTWLPRLAGGPAIWRSFDEEHRAASRVRHPNTVAVFDVGVAGGVPFLVMEHVSGPSLQEELARGRLDAGRARRLGRELLAALGAIHAAGLIHRDVKPSNVLLAPDGSAKVADFGIARAADDRVSWTGPMERSQQLVEVTATGETLGTLGYMTSQRLDGQPATVQSDLYSVGVVLYEALTGTRPFAAATPDATARAIHRAAPVPLLELCQGLDWALAMAVERAMAKDPDDCFLNAAEMSAALGA